MNQVGITIITCLGELRFDAPKDLYTAIGTLYQAVNQSNLGAAKAYFALGEMLVKAHDEMIKQNPTASVRHLMNDAGVHHQKGYRAIRWFEALKDPDGGSFSETLYKDAAHEVSEAVKNGTVRAKCDKNGNPSTRSREIKLGIRPSESPVAQSVTHGSQIESEPFSIDEGYEDPYADEPSPMAKALAANLKADQGDHDDEHDDELDAPTGAFPGRDLHLGGASGEQMMIDFDFRADGRSLHKQLDHAAQMLDDGVLDPARAAGLKLRVDAIKDYMGQLTDEAVA